MNKKIFTILFTTCTGIVSFAQTQDSLATKDTLLVNGTATLETKTSYQAKTDEPIYKLKPAVDVPITAIGTGWSLYAFTKIYSKEGSSPEQIAALDKNNINKFDRWAADVYSDQAADISNYPFYIAMPLPLVLMADRDIRKDAGKIGFLYLESMAITGLLYTGSTYIWDRYRPLAYNDEAPMEERLGGGAKNSFFAGHVALVATSTFFTAKVFSDYHPDSKLKYVFYGTAIAATGATAYLRHMGGKHFPSDILIGTAVGTLSGLLVPSLHKNKVFKNQNLSILPFAGKSNGVALVYRIK